MVTKVNDFIFKTIETIMLFSFSFSGQRGDPGMNEKSRVKIDQRYHTNS